MERWSYDVLDRLWGAIHKWQRKTAHDKVILLVTLFAGIIALASMCMIDSDDWVPIVIALGLSSSWVLAFFYVNCDM